MRHVSQWVSLGALKAWSIPDMLVEQRTGDLIVTAPGAYHQGWNSGANVAEALNWDDGCSQQRLAYYKASGDDMDGIVGSCMPAMEAAWSF
jgi:hypothetical protein